jgi:peptidoglycan/xylan/chitin deacetylase (PgdA/CDA1 family)
MSRRGLPILTYHSIDASRSPISTDPGLFAETLAALAGHGWRCVDIEQWLMAGRPATERAFALTFDDGLRSLRQAAPVLARHGFVATAFLVTGCMGGDNAWTGQPRGIPRLGLLDWREVTDLQSAGIRFAAHTRQHPRLDRLDDPALERELRGSRDDIEDRLGLPCRLLAYPYGVASRRVRQMAACHFAAAFGTRLARATASEDAFALSRIDTYELRTPDALRTLIEGRESARFAARRAVRGTRRALVNLAGLRHAA